MNKTKKWRKILAIMLTLVMMLQNAQTIAVSAGVSTAEIDARVNGQKTQTQTDSQPSQSQIEERANGNQYKAEQKQQQQQTQQTQQSAAQETVNNSSENVDIADYIGDSNSTSGNDTTVVSNANVSATVTQTVFQQEIDGAVYNFVQMTAEIRNNDAENDATGVSLKVLLPSQLTWVSGYGVTTDGMLGYNNPSEAQANGNDISDIPQDVLSAYAGNTIIMWTNQTIGAGQTATYNFAVQIENGLTDLSGVDSAWFVNGTACTYDWVNTEVLAPQETAEPTEEPAPEVTEEPEAEIEEVPEETPEAEETIAPEEDANADNAAAVATLEDEDNQVAVMGEEDEENGDDENPDTPKPSKTSTNLKDYLTNAVLSSSPKFEDGTIYDPNHPAASNGFFYLKLNFQEDKDTAHQYQFPVYKDGDNSTIVTYQMPEGITGFDAVTGAQIKDPDPNNPVVYGEYDITTDGKLTIRFNENVESFTNCAGYIIFQAKFNKTSSSEEWTDKIVFTDDVTVDIKFKKGDNISALKTASEYGNPVPGKFTFTISLTADEAIDNVKIQDKLGTNLILDTDSVKLDGNTPLTVADKGNNQYEFNINQLTAGSHTVTYTASIKPDALLDYQKITTGLDNTATIEYGNNKTLTVHGDAEYEHDWIQKSNTGVDSNTGKIQWTVKVTPPSGQNLDGMVIKDTLPKNGLNYDTKTDIVLKNITKNSQQPINWSQVVLSEDGKSWSYTMPNGSGNDVYEFSYYTTVTGGITGTVSNTATINNKQAATSKVTLSGTGTGSGKVDKQFVTTKDENGVTYAQWKSTLTIPANANSPVIYDDTLTGNHVFDGTLTLEGNGYSSVGIEGWPDDLDKPTITNTNKTFRIDFGTVNKDTELTITLTYYTKVEQSGTVTNKGELSVGGKITSDDASKIINNSVYRKYGNYDENTGIMTWTVVLNTRGNKIQGDIIVEDTISSNQEFKKFSETDRKYAKLIIGTTELPVGTVSGKTLTVDQAITETTDEVLLVYQTVLADGVNKTENVNVTNTATITTNGRNPETITQPEVIPSNIFDKKLLNDPDANADHVANFEINVNSANMTLGAETYTITDTMSQNMELQIDSITVKNKSGATLSNIPLTDAPYYEVTLNGKNFTVTIKNAEKSTDRAYKITYNAVIKAGAGIGKEEWDNKAHFSASTYNRDSSSSGEITKSQSTDSGMSGSRIYIEVSKYNIFSNALPNATFKLYEVGKDGTKTLIKDGGKTTGQDGKLFFGQPDPKTSSSDDVTNAYKFKEGVVYCLEEITPPSGYKLNGDGKYYFQIGNKVDTNEYAEAVGHATIHERKIGDNIQITNMPTTSVSVSKKWKDSDNAYQTRPNNITVYLIADGQKVTGSEKTLSNLNGATTTWENLDKYKYNETTKQYEEIRYSVGENEVEGYTSNITGPSQTNAYEITNTYGLSTVNKKVIKKWDDSNNNDGKRPEKIAIQLQSVENGNSVNIDSDWINAYYDNYKKINNVNEVPAEKKIQYRMNNGNWVEYSGGSIELSGDSKTGEWTCEWKNLPKMGSIGNYQVKEISPVEGYDSPEYQFGSNNDADIITNTRTTEKTSRSVTKQWKSSGDENGNRPEKITVQLFKNNEANLYDTIELNEENHWTHTWSELPKYESGTEITWKIQEVPVPGYNTKYSSANGETIITNTYANETTTISAQKRWIDNNDQDKLRPNAIALKLQKSVYDIVQQKYTDWSDVPNADNKEISSSNWNAIVKWENLPKYENGKIIHYRVQEITADSNLTKYNTTYSPEMVNAGDTNQTITVTNSYSSKASIQFKAQKTLNGNRKKTLSQNEFEFILQGQNNNINQTKQNDASGQVLFDPIEYTQEGTYKYKISEKTGSDKTISYDATEYAVEVTVENDSVKGELKITGIKVDNQPYTENELSNFIANYKFSFTNSYQAQGSGVISGTKELKNGTLTAGLFTFGLYKEDGTTPVTTKVNGVDTPITASNEAPSNGTGKFNLQTPVYTQNDIGKSFTYVVKEIVQNNSTIYDYDTHSWKVQVTVTDSDESDGTLNVTVTTLDGNSTFTNTYNANGVLALNALKSVQNKDGAFKNPSEIPGKFTFELYSSDASGNKQGTTALQTQTNNNEKVKFEEIKYSASDVRDEPYYYLMVENQESVAGYTLSTQKYLVTVKVSDGGNGTLNIKHEITDITNPEKKTVIYSDFTDEVISGTPSFTNVYSATGQIVLRGKKVLNGKTIDITKPENQFKFELYKGEQKIGDQVTINQYGEFSFPALTFDQNDIGVHTYTVKEVNLGAEGYTYADPITVTVTVKDNGNGTLDVSATPNGIDANNNGLIFTNSYSASVDVPLQVKKILEGRKIENEQFSFTLTDSNKHARTAKCNSDGIVKFEPVTDSIETNNFTTLHFNETQVGNTYYYTIKENIPETIPEGYTYSKESYEISIKITDPSGNGKLHAEVRYKKLIDGKVQGAEAVYGEEALTFTNRYEASGKIEISGTKNLFGGKKPLEAGDFSFELYDQDPREDKNAKPIDTTTNTAENTFVFKKLTYTQDNVDPTSHIGTYTYYVKEKNDEKEGYTYDNSVYVVAVTVSDTEGNGQLNVQSTVQKQKTGEEPTGVSEIGFNNIYEADGEVVLQAQKILEGKAIKENAFTFTLTGSDGEVIQKKSNKADGSIVFDPISYDEEDIGETYTYEIREEIPPVTALGYTYSQEAYLAKVTVSDKNGKITTAVEYSQKKDDKETKLTDDQIPTFTNSYKASGSIVLSGVKELTGNKALADDLFTFVLKDADGKQIDETKNKKDGTFTFKTIEYTQNDVDLTSGEKDYTYYVEESPVAENSPYTTSKVVYKIVVHVKDNEEKAVLETSKTVTVEKNDDKEQTDIEKMLFVNHYNAKGQIQFTAKKTLNVPLKAEQFTFILSGNGVYQEATNDAEGNITFEPLNYTEDNIGQYYYYTVHEKDLHVSGYSYSDVIYQIKVHVTDKDNGELSVEKEITNIKNEPVESMEFVNTYSADGQLILTGEKSYASGAKEAQLKAGDYKFEVTESGKVVAEGSNDASGLITFSPIQYEVKTDGNNSDLRTHVYKVKEVKGSLGYVIYDTSEYTVTVQVSDGQDGKLQVKILDITKDGKNTDKIRFVNDVTKVEISKKSITGTDELEGAELEVRDTDGKTILKWTSGKTAKYIEGLLEAGKKYVLAETKAPDGYHLAADVPFTVNSDGTLKQVEMIDSPTEVTVTKTDLTKEKQLVGAVLQIIDKNGTIVDQWTTDGKPHAVTKSMTVGETYTLHEVSAPAGYRVAEDVKFTVNDSGKETNVNMKDAPTKASILKTDESGKGLAGASLAVKDSTGKVLEQWVSDGTAHVIEGLLIVGETYTLTEISAPSGYTLAQDITFTMEDKDVVEVSMKDYQDAGTGQITVTKKTYITDGGMSLNEIIPGNKGDTFYVNLFTDENGQYPFRTSTPKAIVLKDSCAGTVTFDDLPTGTYYVFETDENGNALEMNMIYQHKSADFMCMVETGSTNKVDLDLKAGDKEGYVNLDNIFYDIPDGYSYDAWISISKQVLKGDSQTTVDDTFYAGIFTKDETDGSYNLFKVVELVQNDTVTVEVPLGGESGEDPITYYVLETDADGNIIDLDEFAYEVSGEGSVSLDVDHTKGTIAIVNTLPEEKEGKLRVHKVDENGVGLAGASFRLTDEDGEVVEEWTSQVSAHELNLEPGVYVLTEVQAPTGYTGSGSITITVDDDYNISMEGAIDYSYNDDLLDIVNKPVEVTPTPSATPTPDASVTPQPGGSTGGGSSSGGGTLSGSSANTYNTLSGKVAVKTGDDTPIALYVLLMVVAAALTGGVVYRKRRKNSK